MRLWLALVALGGGAGSAVGQGEKPDSIPPGRSVTVLGGLGNAMGWLGVQGEKYVARSRVSLFGGLGYTPEIEDGDASGVAGAFGVRGYTAGLRHRGFLEASISQVVIESGCFDDCSRFYGPGLQVGYQFASRGGFSLLVSAGLGFAPGATTDEVGALLGLGFGYTWRR